MTATQSQHAGGRYGTATVGLRKQDGHPRRLWTRLEPPVAVGEPDDGRGTLDPAAAKLRVGTIAGRARLHPRVWPGRHRHAEITQYCRMYGNTAVSGGMP